MRWRSSWVGGVQRTGRKKQQRLLPLHKAAGEEVTDLGGGAVAGKTQKLPKLGPNGDEMGLGKILLLP